MLRKKMSDYNKPIKITKIEDKVYGAAKNVEKKYRKLAYEDKAKDKFQNITVKVTWQQGEKLDEFIAYCQNVLMCFSCMKKSGVEYYKSNEQDELILSCPHCCNITIDSSTQSKQYVKWFNSILENYGMNFIDGFPKLISTVKNNEVDIYNTTKSWVT
jgi:hypothetical protein